MRSRRPRRWESREDDDPLAGLVNLFDLWMVFSIALLIVFAGASRRRSVATEGNKPDAASSSVPLQEARSIPKYRLSREELSGSGERLGTAYRLPSGEVVCVPDGSELPAPPR
ncbi:DUF2149 domain-containing protein [Singulisphaera sp. PoT]|uniref:DUF2149 domain-containing protein n=1 Tax=Singulisphaera sp. PoT TaxID=3411797 RepID=UPI003BF5395F